MKKKKQEKKKTSILAVCKMGTSSSHRDTQCVWEKQKYHIISVMLLWYLCRRQMLKQRAKREQFLTFFLLCSPLVSLHIAHQLKEERAEKEKQLVTLGFTEREREAREATIFVSHSTELYAVLKRISCVQQHY